MISLIADNSGDVFVSKKQNKIKIDASTNVCFYQ